jgi:cytochrome c oxidase cbb3-type subunit 3
MNKKIILTAFILLGTTLMVQAQTPAPQEPSMFDGPNGALGILAFMLLVAILSVVGVLRKLTNNPEYFVKLRKMKSSSESKTLGLLLLFTGAASIANAQSALEPATYPKFLSDPNTVWLLALDLALILVFIYVTRVLMKTISLLMPEKAKVEQEEVTAESKIFNALVDIVPIEREDEILMDHEYDGIRELDNNLPPWWVYLFYATIIWGFAYLGYIYLSPFGQSQDEEYLAEVAQAEVDKAAYLATMKSQVDENTVTYLTDASELKAGKAIYMELCQVCHAPDGGGGVGPNLTDKYWLHGGSVQNVFSVIKYGVAAKGMISWESQLRPAQMAQVASYVMSLQGTTPAAPKEPQGELYVPADAAPVDTAPTEDAEMSAEGEVSASAS